MRLTAVNFPNPRLAGEDGLLCVGGDLKVETLYAAYHSGIFPWPQEGLPMLWFSPEKRGVLDFNECHFSRRFLRELRTGSFQVSFNKDFAQVINECALRPRKHETGTWILPEMIQAYQDFHQAGYAHSVECWLDDRLVGGLYGVWIEGVFSGESMFFKQSNASKICLYFLIEKLKDLGLSWMDTQMVTPVLEAAGAKYISREDFLQRLADERLKQSEQRRQWS